MKYVFSGFFFVKDERNYANTDGSVIAQDVVRSWPTMQITAISSRLHRLPEPRERRAADGARVGVRARVGPRRQRGRWGEEAAAKLKAKPVDVGRYDLVLDPSHLWLTIHESVAHPTELDRAMGYEANYAGTELRGAAGEQAGHLPVRPIDHERRRRPLAGRRAVDDRLRRRRREARPLRHRQERHLRRLPDDARAGAVAAQLLREGRQAGALARLLVRAGVEQRAVPAHAERVAAAERARTRR